MEDPLCVVPHVSKAWMARTTFDLLIFPDRLVLVRAPSLRQMRTEERIENAMLGSPRSFAEITERLVQRSGARLAAIRELTDAQVLAQDPGNMVVPVASIRSARLRKRPAGVWRLRCALEDGSARQWSWMARLGAPDKVVPALERALDYRLTM